MPNPFVHVCLRGQTTDALPEGPDGKCTRGMLEGGHPLSLFLPCPSDMSVCGAEAKLETCIVRHTSILRGISRGPFSSFPWRKRV